jgi:hypothetical protein
VAAVARILQPEMRPAFKPILIRRAPFAPPFSVYNFEPEQFVSSVTPRCPLIVMKAFVPEISFSYPVKTLFYKPEGHGFGTARGQIFEFT